MADVFGELTPLVLVVATWLLPVLVVGFALYLVVRRAVRDGMLDARRVDAEEAAERRARTGAPAGPPPAPGADRPAGGPDGTPGA